MADNMRVVLTSESYLPYVSGVTVSADALARGLVARGHQVLLVAPRPARGSGLEGIGSPGPEPAYAWLPSYQAPIVAPAAYRMPWPNPFAAAWRAAAAFRPDVVHANSPFVTGVLARRLARASGAPLVFTHHTRFAEYSHYLGPLAGPASRATDAYLARFWAGCAAIVAPSEDLAREIRARLRVDRAARVHVIPTGVDVAGIRAMPPVDPRHAAGWPADAVVAVSLGRLAPEKSPDLLFDAVAAAGARVPLLRLLAVGGGPSEAALRARAERPDLAGRVRFTGALPRPAALAHMAGGDLLVFTSRTETQGLVLAEALSAGLPAVAVDGPGVRDSVRDGLDGDVVAAEPSATLRVRLADAIAALATAPERRGDLARRATTDAGRFDLALRVEQVEDLYRSLRDR